MDIDRETRIRQRAYQLWLDEGSPEGKQHDHWAQAESAKSTISMALTEAVILQARTSCAKRPANTPTRLS